MEAYTGIKFKAVFEGVNFDYSAERKAILEELARLGEDSLLDRNNGNISVRVEDGMVITPSGKNMADIAEDDMVLVTGVDERRNLVRTVGKTPPSSESFVHWLIYSNFPRVNAVVHFHSKAVLENLSGFAETDAEYPYGTVELAHAVLEAFKTGRKRLVIMKGHGIVVMGKNLPACHATIRRALKSINKK